MGVRGRAESELWVPVNHTYDISQLWDFVIIIFSKSQLFPPLKSGL